MAAILVTGGAGYVGSHTVATLLEQTEDIDIIVVDNLCNAYCTEGAKKPESLRIIEEIAGKNIQFYNLDIRDSSGLSKIFEKVNVLFDRSRFFIIYLARL